MRRVLAVALATATLALAGCVSIPTSGTIDTGEAPVEEPGVAIPLPPDPVLDGTPEEIVEGFLRAGAAGLADDFRAARLYLTATAATGWNPRAGVLVYGGGGPGIEQQGSTVLVTVPVTASIDGAGRYAEAPPGASTQLPFELRQDAAGQWQITSVPDGVLMSVPNFQTVYRSARVYFASPDLQHLVPELRWFPAARLETSATTALLDGPSPWLADAVVSGFPEDARLSTGAVTVSRDNVASIDLVNRGTDANRNLMQTQLLETLTRLGGTFISRVELTVGGLPWEATRVPQLARDVMPSEGPYVVQDDVLAVVSGGRTVPVPDLPSLAGVRPTNVAVSLGGGIHVVLDGTRRLLLLTEGAEAPAVIHEGARLVAPSVDRHGWVWTGEQASAGELVAVDQDGVTVPVQAEWLEGRTLRAIQVSLDGSRIAVVSVGPDDGAAVHVAALVRDETGQPQRVGAGPLPVAQQLTDAFDVSWADEVTLAVLGTSGTLEVPAVHTVPVGGPSEGLPLPEGTAAQIAAVRERVYVVDRDGVLRRWQSPSWFTVTEDVQGVAFPG